jgi:hypothetical protein
LSIAILDISGDALSFEGPGLQWLVEITKPRPSAFSGKDGAITKC